MTSFEEVQTAIEAANDTSAEALAPLQEALSSLEQAQELMLRIAEGSGQGDIVEANNLLATAVAATQEVEQTVLGAIASAKAAAAHAGKATVGQVVIQSPKAVPTYTEQLAANAAQGEQAPRQDESAPLEQYTRPLPTQLIDRYTITEVTPTPAPLFNEAAQDPTRQETVAGYRAQDPTEHEALQELKSLVDRYIANGTNDELVREAISIRDSLNYIDNKTLETACDVIAQDWRQYLEADPKRQILVAPGISRAVENGTPKSDDYVLEKVLSRLDIDDIGSRIVGSIDELRADPDDTRAIFLEDWTLSGLQLTSSSKRFAADNPNSPYIDRLEVNLIIAHPDMIRDGFAVIDDSDLYDDDTGDYTFDRPLPVKAVFVAQPRLHADAAESLATQIHVTGSHSAGDFGFSDSIEQIIESLEYDGSEVLSLPTLASATINNYGALDYSRVHKLYDIDADTRN